MWDGRDGNTTEKGAFGGKPSDEKKFMEKFSFHLKKHVAQNPFTLSSFTLPEQYKTESELQIRSYTQRDKKSEQLSKVIQKTIEQTLPNVEWQGKRGNIKYHPEDSTLESR
ncbi:MAG: hypothetical protein LBD11_07870 [Candidatus Peribacteria bacterium]|jgi:hypothetical protein|nr:hypothetical protein [Candidatus Peribacteria bacterium]